MALLSGCSGLGRRPGTGAVDRRQPVGLLACAGRFPIVFAEKARECGIPVVCVGVAGMADPALKDALPEFHWLRRLVAGLRHPDASAAAACRRWTMAGKFHKHLLYRPWRLGPVPPRLADAAVLLLPPSACEQRRLAPARADREFRSAGLECVSALDLCPELLVREGVLTRRRPTAPRKKDIAFGWQLAREMGRLDVGQSVMVRERAVLAVEAIEGTDRAIERAGELCSRSAGSSS